MKKRREIKRIKRDELKINFNYNEKGKTMLEVLEDYYLLLLKNKKADLTNNAR